MTEMTINKLPSKTWYWLHVNETKLPWDKEHTTELPEETVTAGNTEEVRFSITGEGRYSSKKIHIIAPAGKQVTVFMDYQTEEKLAVRTSLSVEEHARVRLVQLQHTAENSLVYNQIEGECAKNARIELVQIYLGKGDIYSDTTINLNGDASTFRSDIGYIGQHTHIIDMNEVVNHYGKHTESEINVGGALRDGAKKIFRGTIDFENKTVPVILCSEENVVGNHGATIGELDEDTMFYFASRGIDKEHAENIMARANIDRLKGIIKDDSFARMIDEELGEV